jgi:hypothetical protein
VNPVDPTEDEWRLVERAVGIDRGWNAAYQLVSTLDPAWARPLTKVAPDGPATALSIQPGAWASRKIRAAV